MLRMQDYIQTVASVAALGAASVALYIAKNSNTSRDIRSSGTGKVIVDSCALIDGRIVDLAKLGFLSQEIIVPEFVIAELQLLADGGDSHKRERARYGLEVVQLLQNEASVVVSIGRYKPQDLPIDDKLVQAAKRDKAALFTNDFNLNQVASIEGVRVLNINELSHALRPHVLPSEKLTVKIVQPGSNRDQGVGYLDDGTMVVVDGALKDIGTAVEATVTRTHQTVAGKMIFAKKNTARVSTQKATASRVIVPAGLQKQLRTKSPKNQRRRVQSERDSHIRTQVQRQKPRAMGTKETAEASLLAAIDQATIDKS